MNKRIEKVNSLIERELSKILLKDVDFPFRLCLINRLIKFLRF